jgi:hypothetical protein
MDEWRRSEERRTMGDVQGERMNGIEWESSVRNKDRVSLRSKARFEVRDEEHKQNARGRGERHMSDREQGKRTCMRGRRAIQRNLGKAS